MRVSQLLLVAATSLPLIAAGGPSCEWCREQSSEPVTVDAGSSAEFSKSVPGGAFFVRLRVDAAARLHISGSVSSQSCSYEDENDTLCAFRAEEGTVNFAVQAEDSPVSGTLSFGIDIRRGSGPSDPGPGSDDQPQE
jgi:hypothetical protein